MRVFGQRLEIADAVITCSGLEFLAERQDGKRRVTSGTGAADRPSLGIYPLSFRKVAGAIDTIGDVDDPPITLQPQPILAAVSSAAAVIDVEDGEATAGPILRSPTEGGGCGRGGAAVTMHDQRRQMAGGRPEISVFGRIKQTVGLQPIVGVELDRLGLRKVPAIRFEVLCDGAFQPPGAA